MKSQNEDSAKVKTTIRHLRGRKYQNSSTQIRTTGNCHYWVPNNGI